MFSPINWFYKGKINVTILATFLIISIFPLGVAVASYFFTTRQALHSTATYHLENLADWEAKLIRKWFSERMGTVRMIADSPEVRAKNWPAALELMSRTQKHTPEFRSIAFVNLDGKTVIDTTGKTNIDVSDRQYFQASVKGREYVSEMIMARTYNLPCIVFSSPVRVDGKIIGVLFGSVAVDALSDGIMGFSIGETGENFLVDRRGNLVTIPNSMRKMGADLNQINPAPSTKCISEGLEGRDGLIKYNDHRGVSIVGFRKWLPDLQMLLITKQDEAEALQKAGGWGLKTSLAAGLFLVLMILPVVWYIAGRISKPLVAITTAVNEIAAGNLSHRVEYVKSNEEIELLGHQINDLVSTVEKSMEVISEQVQELEEQKKSITAQKEDVLKAYEQLAQANKNLQQMAATDQLTETFNRRYFMDRLRNEILLSMRTKRPLAVAIIDIDHFKSVNDTYGHKAGDQILKGLVGVVSSVIRRSDLLARFGGEEFAVLAPDTNLEGGLILAEKIRSAVASHKFEIDDGSLNITISIGVSCIGDFNGQPEKAEDQLLLTADRYLYVAKNNGRNRVEGAGCDPV